MLEHAVDRRHPEAFWGGIAEELHSFVPWTKVLEWDLPWAKWFVNGKINLWNNRVDRHALGDKAGKVAILWEGEPGGVLQDHLRRATARQGAEVANVLKGLGIRKGDRVAVYMGDDPVVAIGNCRPARALARCIR